MASWELIEELGRGGMGVVHRARNRATGQEAALKCLLPAADGGDGDTLRFKREMETLRELAHPNIIKVLECGEMDGRWYYAMELVQGQSLDRLLASAGAFEIPRALKVLRQAASALAACHAQGFVHRDIKPANLMLSGTDHVTLMDFGLVRVENRTVLTATGEVMGTPHYVGPELLRGDPPGPGGDVYALGIVLLELLSGKPPFNAQSMAQLLAEILTGGPRPLDALRPEAPAPLVELVRRMTANDPAERPSAADVVAELDRMAAAGARRTGKVDKRPRLTTSMKVVPPARNDRRALIGLAVLLAALTAAAVLRFAPREPAPVAASATPAPTPAVTGGARVAVDPPRGAKVYRTDDGDWQAGTAWVVKRGAATVAEGRLERAARELALTGLEPASTYKVEVRSEGPPLALTFDTPRQALGHLRLEWGAVAASISLAQPGHETFVLTVKGPDEQVVWNQKTSDPALFAAVRNLKPETKYTLYAKVEGNNVWFLPSAQGFTMNATRVVDMQRQKLRAMGELSIMAGASDLGSPYVARMIELYPEIVTAMQGRGATDNDILVACFDALGEIADPRAVPVIATALEQNHDTRVVRRAFDALALLHRPEGFDLALRHAKHLRQDSGEDALSLATALFGSDPARAAERFRGVASEPTRFSSIDRLAANPYMAVADAEELVPLLIRPALARLDATAGHLAFHLSLMGGRASHDALRAIVTEAHARSAPALLVAVRALGRAGDPADAPLIATVLSSPDAATRREAVTALGHAGGPAAEAPLLALLDDRDPQVRRRAALALGRARARGAVDSLVARLATDTESRGRIPRALALIGDARAAQGLIARLDRPVTSRAPFDADDVDRAETIWALGVLRDPRVLPLADRALASGSEYARLRAAEALGHLGDRAALPALRRARARAGEHLSLRQAFDRAIDWLEGKRPRPRGFAVVDAAEHSAGRFVRFFPGEAASIQVGGAWAIRPGAALIGADGGMTPAGRRLRFHARCRGTSDHPENHPMVWMASWNGGPVLLDIEGEEADGMGFLTCWIE